MTYQFVQFVRHPIRMYTIGQNGEARNSKVIEKPGTVEQDGGVFVCRLIINSREAQQGGKTPYEEATAA